MRKLHRFSLLLTFAMLVSSCAWQAFEEESDLPLVDEPPGAIVTTRTPATMSEAEPVVISFGDQEYRRASYQPLIEQFHTENPDIRVEFVPLDALARDGESSPFDVETIVRNVDVAALLSLNDDDAKRGLVLDLKPLLDGDVNLDPHDFFPAALSTANSSVYLIPSLLHLPLLHYNRDLWDAAALPAPAAEWQLADFSSAIGELADKRGETIQTYGYVGPDSAVALLISELTAVNGDTNAVDVLQLDSPQVVQALERTAKLVMRGAIFMPPDGHDITNYETMRALVQEGKAGVWDAQISLFDTTPAFALGTAVMPKDMALRHVVGEGYVISAGTQAPEAAWRWLSFLSRQEVNVPTATERGPSVIPARRSVAEASGYWKKLDEQSAVAVRSIVEQLAATPSTASADELYEPLQQALRAVVGGADPVLAAREAQSSLDQQGARAAVAPDAQAPTAPFVVAPQTRAVAGAEATHIVFSDPYYIGRFEQLVEQFNEQNDDVFVELKAAPPASSTVQMADIAATSDCFLWWSQPTAEDESLLVDLQPLIDADAGFPRDDYPAVVLSAYRQNGVLYGLPLEVTFPVLAYNAVVFERAGIEPPSAEWTLDDMIEAAARLTTGEGKNEQYGYSAAGSFSTLYFLYHAGVALTSGEGDTLRPNYTDPHVVQALRTYLDLLKTASPNDQLNDYTRDGSIAMNAYSLRDQGRVGMWYQFGLNPGSFDLGNEQYFRPQIIPLPGVKAQSAALFEGNSLHISAGTEHQQACWKWMTFLSNEASTTTYGIPARLSIAESDAFLSGALSGTATVVAWYRAQAATTTDTSRSWQSSIDFYWFHRAIDRALHGENLDFALDEAQQLTMDFLSCTRTEKARPACAKQVDPEYNGW